MNILSCLVDCERIGELYLERKHSDLVSESGQLGVDILECTRGVLNSLVMQLGEFFLGVVVSGSLGLALSFESTHTKKRVKKKSQQKLCLRTC